MTGIIAHEWLERTGGSENVFAELALTFPDAEQFCLWNDGEGRFPDAAESWLARTPLRRSKALALPVMPFTWRTLPKRDADWVLASSHLFAHHAKFGGKAAHARKFVYAYTPARYVWVPELDGRGNGFVARTVSSLLKPVDRKRAQEAHSVVGISRFIADRISDTWERDVEVIYPPVDVDDFAPGVQLSARGEDALNGLPEGYVLGFSRFVPYKRLERAIEVGAAADLPVVIAGAGPDEGRLRAFADAKYPGRVYFVIRPSFEQLRYLYENATVVVFAPIEDFGIVPVEAMAAGTPVIVNAVGGASETIIDGVTGAHVRDWNTADMRTAVERAVGVDRAEVLNRANAFGPEIFREAMRNWVLDSAHTEA